MEKAAKYLKIDSFILFALLIAIPTLFSFIVTNIWALWIGELDITIPLKVALIVFIVSIIITTLTDILSALSNHNLVSLYISIVLLILPSSVLIYFNPLILQFFYENFSKVSLSSVNIEIKIILTAALILNLSFVFSTGRYLIRLLEDRRVFTKIKLTLLLLLDKFRRN